MDNNRQNCTDIEDTHPNAPCSFNPGCRVANLTQHAATCEQRACGVTDLNEESVIILRDLLTFHQIPTRSEIERRALALTAMAQRANVRYAMVGGAPYLMEPLCQQLRKAGISPLFAFSRRVSVENPETGEKRSIFRHEGFVAA